MITLTVDDNPNVLQSVRDGLLRLDPNGTHRIAASGDEALELVAQFPPDVIFLDVEMPGLNGLEVAQWLNTFRPQTNIVFITGHAEYALSALELYASGFLLKPISEEQLDEALRHLRYPVSTSARAFPKRLKAQCFGQFEVWCGDKPVVFQRRKTKELFAYLIDRNGALCSMGQLISFFWPEAPGDTAHASHLRMLIADLQTTLTDCGFGEALVRSRGMLGVNPSLLDCDYFHYLSGSPEGKQSFHGEYMSQYSFGESTLAKLMRMGG